LIRAVVIGRETAIAMSAARRRAIAAGPTVRVR
jgi:hypothetical protein